MFKSFLSLACLLMLVDSIISLKHNASSSSFRKLSMNDESAVYNDWANYHKKTDGKLDSVLAKCYDCIEKKSGYHEQTVCSDFTGLNTITNYGILNAGTSFLNGIYTLYNPSYGYAQVNTYNYGGKSYNPFSQSISCMVGTSTVFSAQGFGPVPMPCEYGNSYCSITVVDNAQLFQGSVSGQFLHYACAAVCHPSAQQICTTGTLSNKIGPICFVGDLSSGNSAPAVQCDIGSFCQLDAANTATCASAPFDCINNKCSFDDFGNKVGPICWVGTFDKDATLQSCGATIATPPISDYCIVYTTTDNKVIGDCSVDGTDIPTGAKLISKSRTDFGNKQGPICFVGQFGDNAEATACTIGKVCQRETIQTEAGTTITIGSCSSKCYASRNTFCCSTDLCNTYHSEVNYEVREMSYSEDRQYSAASGYGSSYNGYNKQLY